MLKDRKEGLIYLHWCALTLAAVGVYIGWVAVARAVPSFGGIQGTNVLLYLMGVVVASFWIQQNLKHVSHRLGDLGLFESMRQARHQLLRYIVVLFAIVFLTKDTLVSRKFLLGYISLMGFVLTVGNIYLPKLLLRLFFRKALIRTILVLKSGEIGKLHELLTNRSHIGTKLVGWVGEGELPRKQLPKLGEIDDLKRIIEEHAISQVVISQHSFSPEAGRAIAQCAEEAGCRVRFFLQAQKYFPDQPIDVEREGPFMFMAPANEPLENPVNRLLKRWLDIAISLPIVVLVLPPLSLFVWFMQRRQSPGPLIHRQYRSGLNRNKFLMFKFRTMHVSNSATDLTQQARRDDSRIFPVGRFLRRTSLDEFPQFLNVLLGDMSVTGPRPHLLEHDERFAKIVNSYYARHFVKPGITGLAQCQGFRGEISEPTLLHKRIHWDMFYIRRWTFSLDLQILLQTIRQVFFPPRSAY